MLGHDALSIREHGATLHGFRSTLSTWAEEQDDGRAYPRAVIKAVLAHGKGDAVTAAYLRSDLFKARRKLMEHGHVCNEWTRWRSVRCEELSWWDLGVRSRIASDTPVFDIPRVFHMAFTEKGRPADS